MNVSIEEKELENLFIYHAPKGDQAKRYETLRAGGLAIARIIVTHCPDSRERSLAVTKMREAIMWANAAIACNE